MTRSKTEDLMAQSRCLFLFTVLPLTLGWHPTTVTENLLNLLCPRALVSSLVSTATTLFLLASVSAFLYATFYYAYMPVEMVDMPVHLQFQPCEGQTADR